jgi:uncharacterized protein (DUF4213/DUF364 family)
MEITAPESNTWHRHALYRDLARDVRGSVRRVVVGLNWTLVVGTAGAGLAHTPLRGTSGCHALPESGGYGTQDLATLAALLGSSNVFERTIALAAINAYHNSREVTGNAENGLELIEGDGSDTVIVGRFPDLDRRLPGAAIIERNPGPGDHPPAAAAQLLPACKNLIVTASALQDGALPGLLALAPQAFSVLLGPGTPFAPCLFGHGVDALSGFIADDIDALSRVVAQGGSVRAMKRHGRILTWRHDPQCA